jgi:hypothetical protein
LAIVGLFPAAASAQEVRSAPGSDSGPLTLVLDLAPGTRLDAETLRAGVAHELDRPVTSERGARGGTLVVREEGERVVVSFDGPDGRHDGRSILLAVDPAQAVQDIALLAGNVARDQASQFAPAPAAASAPAPAASPPAAGISSEPRPSPCDASGPTLFAGVDLAPFAGVSTVDRGRSIRNFSLGIAGDLSGGVKGVAVSGALALARGPLCGAQVAGAVDVAGDSTGAQIAGLASFARRITGTQIAGGANLTAALTGVQVGGVANVTGALTGVQIAGGANVAWDDAVGAQIGPFNVATSALHGIQIGVVNYAQDADFQLGVVNVVASGRLRLDAWSKPEMGLLLAGVKHGGRHYHWIYGVGTRLADPSRAWAVLGLGAHATPAANVYVDFDAIDHLQLDFPGGWTTNLYEARATVGYALLPQVSVFAGPTFNVLEAANSARAGAPGYAAHLTDTSSMKFSAWPGVTLGVEGL